jgi:hypothetical protein
VQYFPLCIHVDFYQHICNVICITEVTIFIKRSEVGIVVGWSATLINTMLLSVSIIVPWQSLKSEMKIDSKIFDFYPYQRCWLPKKATLIIHILSFFWTLHNFSQNPARQRIKIWNMIKKVFMNYELQCLHMEENVWRILNID